MNKEISSDIEDELRPEYDLAELLKVECAANMSLATSSLGRTIVEKELAIVANFRDAVLSH